MRSVFPQPPTRFPLYSGLLKAASYHLEEKETWIASPQPADGAEAALVRVPAIALRYWREDTNDGPGTGRTRSYRYSQYDPHFDRHWEILYDW